MKRHLALITAVGMVSSFSLSNAVDATGEFLEGPNSVRVVCVSERKKKKKSGFGLISRLVKSAIYNGALIAGAMHVTDKIGYTDQNNIKGKFNNLVDVFKKSSGVEDFVKNLMSNPDAVNTLNTACYTIPAGITLGSIRDRASRNIILDAGYYACGDALAVRLRCKCHSVHDVIDKSRFHKYGGEVLLQRHMIIAVTGAAVLVNTVRVNVCRIIL